MNELIIIANPREQSFSYAILNSYCEYCNEKKHTYEIIDLYHSAPSYLSCATFPENEVESIQQQITKADKLVFIHPLYWISMPAIMKNFIEQIFTEGFAYKYEGEKHIYSSLISGKSALVLTTGNSKRDEYDDFGGSTDFEIVWKDILFSMGIENSEIDYLGGILNMSAEDREKVLSSIAMTGRMSLV